MFCPSCAKKLEGPEAEHCDWRLKELPGGSIEVTYKPSGTSFVWGPNDEVERGGVVS